MGQSSVNVLSLIRIDPVLQILPSNLAMKSVKAKFNNFVQRCVTHLLIGGKTADNAGRWWNFGYTGESSAYWFNCLTNDAAQYICQLNLAIRQSRRYWVYGLQYETQRSDLWKSCSCTGIWSKFMSTTESWANIFITITFCLAMRLANKGNLGDIQLLCQSMRHGLTYLWQSHHFCWHIKQVWAHPRSTSQRVTY